MPIVHQIFPSAQLTISDKGIPLYLSKLEFVRHSLELLFSK